MARILLVGPERARCSEVRGLLAADGHRVIVYSSLAGWRERERTLLPDLIVAAVPEVEAVLAETTPAAAGFPPPLLFVHHGAEPASEIDLADRLVDRLAAPFGSEELLGRVEALIRVRRVVLGAPEAHPAGAEPSFRRLGRRVAAWLGGSRPEPRSLQAHHDVASRVARWADRRDAFEPGHAERVTELCAMIAETLALGDADTTLLLRAAMLHDIGKVALPADVLNQRSPLDEGQLRLIRTHARRGAVLTQALGRDAQVAAVILHHHERPDGRGYYGIPGDEVPVVARILAVAEAFDAMISTRLVRPLSPSEALERLGACKGAQFDVESVEALTSRMRPRPRSIRLVDVGPTA